MTRPTGRPGPAYVDELRNPMGDPLPSRPPAMGTTHQAPPFRLPPSPAPKREPEATKEQVAAMDSTMQPLEPGRVIRMVDADGRVWKWDGETRR